MSLMGIQRKSMPAITRLCNECHQEKPFSQYYKCRLGKRGLMGHCKTCHDKRTAKYGVDPRKRMYCSSRLNARRKGLPHTIQPEDIPLPKVCKYLGITIDYRRASERGRLRSFDAPSIDRIDPAIGYVPGNIQVISDLANRMKSDATVEQLVAFAEGVLRVHG